MRKHHISLLIALFFPFNASAIDLTLNLESDFQVSSPHNQFKEGGVFSDGSYHNVESDTLAAISNLFIIHADQKADNGISYGAVIEMYADASSPPYRSFQNSNARQTYLYAESAYGRLEAGAVSSATSKMRIDAGTIARATGGIDGDFDQYQYQYYGTAFFCVVCKPTLPSDEIALPDYKYANKISYFSPTFEGINFGISYTPVRAVSGTASAFNGAEYNEENDVNFGIQLHKNLGNNVTAAASFTTLIDYDFKYASNELPLLSPFAIGGRLSWEDFSIAGSYGSYGKDYNYGCRITDEPCSAPRFWNIGAAYSIDDSMGVSLSYFRSNIGNNRFNLNNNFETISLGADYSLAQGLTTYAELNHIQADYTFISKDSSKVLLPLVGIKANF